MKILVSNDDGVHAEGIKTLAKHLREIADVTVVAPDRNHSGASNSLTITRPLKLKQIKEQTYSVEGTPTDCVHLALTGLLDSLPDMVVSGINDSANLGDDVWYSGTVAAATEGRFLGLPAIAVSLAGHEPVMHYETAARVVKRLVNQLHRDPLPASTILNVNVPDVPFKELRGYEVTRTGTRHIAEPTIKQEDPRGNIIYWIGPPGPTEDAGPGTDFHVISQCKVSITPLRVDLTHYRAFEQLSTWIQGLNESSKV